MSHEICLHKEEFNDWYMSFNTIPKLKHFKDDCNIFEFWELGFIRIDHIMDYEG